MSIKPRLKVASVQNCIAYLRDMLLNGAKSVHIITIDNEPDEDTSAYYYILRNALKYAKQCADIVLAAGASTGLDKVFQATYGKTMREYLKGCLDDVEPPKKENTGYREYITTGEIIRYSEDVVHCYLGFLTAVEAIATESTITAATPQQAVY